MSNSWPRSKNSKFVISRASSSEKKKNPTFTFFLSFSFGKAQDDDDEKKKDAAGWNLNEASHDQVAKPPCLFLEEEDGRCWAFFRRGKVIWQISVSWEMADGGGTFLEVLKRGRGGKFFYCIYGVKSRKIPFKKTFFAYFSSFQIRSGTDWTRILFHHYG